MLMSKENASRRRNSLDWSLPVLLMWHLHSTSYRHISKSFPAFDSRSVSALFFHTLLSVLQWRIICTVIISKHRLFSKVWMGEQQSSSKTCGNSRLGVIKTWSYYVLFLFHILVEPSECLLSPSPVACEVTGLGRRQRGALQVPQAIAQPPACCAGLCLGQGYTLANQTTREGSTGRKASSPELYLNSLFLTSPSQVSALSSWTLLCGGASFHMLVNCTQDECAGFLFCALSGLAFSVAEDMARKPYCSRQV